MHVNGLNNLIYANLTSSLRLVYFLISLLICACLGVTTKIEPENKKTFTWH